MINFNRKQRNGQQVVLYNEEQRRIVLREDTNGKFGKLEIPRSIAPTICQFCRRPFNVFDSDNNDFMNQDYFRVLDDAHRMERQPKLEDSELPNVKNIPKSAFNQGYYGRFFREGRKLGHGAIGSVFLAQHVLENEALGEYAVKKVAVGDNIKWLHRMLNEVHIMEKLRHSNIISYKHTWLEIHRQSQFAPSVPFLFILMEFANGGNLEDLVLSEVIDINHLQKSTSCIKEINYLPIPDVLRLFLGICRGLEYLHDAGIIHRDLKPSNILLNYNRESVNVPTVLISDFGECNAGSDLLQRTGGTGTIEFCAPELFRVDNNGNYLVNHSKSTDMWSLGIVLYFLLFGGKLPYSNVDNFDLLANELLSLKTIKIPGDRDDNDVPPLLKCILTKLLSVDPGQRPSAKETRSTIEKIISMSESFDSPSNFEIKEQINLLPGTKKPKLPHHRVPFTPAVILLAISLVPFCYPKSLHCCVVANLIIILGASKINAPTWAIITFIILEIAYFSLFSTFHLCAL